MKDFIHHLTTIVGLQFFKYFFCENYLKKCHLYKIYTIIIMKKVLEYLLTNKLAQIPRRGNKEMKSIVIDDKKSDLIKINPYQRFYKRN